MVNLLNTMKRACVLTKLHGCGIEMVVHQKNVGTLKDTFSVTLSATLFSLLSYI